MELKNKLEDYTEAEFLSLLNKIWAVDVSEEEHDNLIDHFEKLVEHPNGNGLIFYPENGVEDSPEGVLKVIKEWRAENGKPGFKE
ncbi:MULTISPECIES: bacteriocin immunity protein [Photorhabdus]|uniref:bacteriocin immunity protein n=1 Tax=Photorhabdus TaxID=29487 RepID=UPI000DCF4431|nr:MULTISPECIES: bacteriocin immunity protein [Photorhabdus]MCT8345082.1 bacteriocin immunity protein [Photorhabdus kleinii]RAX01854.1 bacteriocin immunity protein [Photorhabdus sp. S9-53]RAX02386.1 bacteriocin immunity protein [Photorhabdus sp. S10-54]RAX05425.1 bacteriocin immunity protein [Photorhabdus sp. S8-52]